MQLDQSGIARQHKAEKAHNKKERQKQSQSPFRHKLLESNLPPKSIRMALSTFASGCKHDNSDLEEDLMILDKSSEDEMTQVRKMQLKTEKLIK